MNKQHYIIDITTNNGKLIISSATLEIGAQYDNETQVFMFDRPEVYSEADLLLYFTLTGQDGIILDNLEPINLGRENVYTLTSDVTRSQRFRLQIAFRSEEETVEHSNILGFLLRQSLNENTPIGPSIPERLRTLDRSAFIKVESEDGKIMFFTTTGETTTVSIPTGGEVDVGEVTTKTLDAGEDAIVEVFGDDKLYFTFAIPRGADGEDGIQGEKGDPGPNEISFTTKVDGIEPGKFLAADEDGKITGLDGVSRKTKNDSNWDVWNTEIFSFGFPDKNIPQIYNMLEGGPLYNNGMFVCQCGPNSRWNQQNFPNGGHCFEGWSVDRTHRFTCVVLQRNTDEITSGNSDFIPDGLARAAVQIFDYTTQKFGWLKVGSDSKYDNMGGWDFTDTWCKAHTPITFRKQAAPVNMPGQNGNASIPVHDGTMYYGEDGYLHLYTRGVWKKLALVEEDPDHSVTVTETSGDGYSLERSDEETCGQPFKSEYAYGYTDYIPAKIGDKITVSAFARNAAATATIWCYDSEERCLAAITCARNSEKCISAGVAVNTENRALYDFDYVLPQDEKIANCTKIRVVAHKYDWLDIEAHPFYVTVTYNH